MTQKWFENRLTILKLIGEAQALFVYQALLEDPAHPATADQIAEVILKLEEAVKLLRED